MRKTAEEIEADIFEAFKAFNDSSVFTDEWDIEFRGTLPVNTFLNGTRPFNSRIEEAVITFISGIDDQVQTGIVNINVYVPNINNGVNKGVMVKNVKRCKQVSIALKEFQLSIRSFGEYYFTLDSIIKTFKVDEIEEHFVNCRLKFKRITF